MRLFNLLGLFLSLYISVILLVTIFLTGPIRQQPSAVYVDQFKVGHSKTFTPHVSKPRWTASDRLSKADFELVNGERLEFEEEFDEQREALYHSLDHLTDMDSDNTS